MSDDELVIRATLAGGGELGDVPAADVARLIEGLIGVVVQAAGAAVGQRVAATGRRTKIIELASKVRLVEIKSGSVQVALRAAAFYQEPGTLGLEVSTVSEDAFRIAVRTASTHAELYPEVAAAWADALEPFHLGDGYQTVRVALPGMKSVTIDAARRDRLRSIAGLTLHKMNRRTLQGVLYSANFETMTGRLRAPNGNSIEVQFDLEHAPEVKEALRDLTTLAGEVRYDPATSRVVSIRLQEIEHTHQMTTDHFWGHRPVGELAVEQGVTTVQSAASLVAGSMTDDEWASFARELGIEA